MLRRALHPDARGVPQAVGLHRACCVVLIALLLLLGGACPSHATLAKNEHELRAAIMFNLSRFVSWPETAFAERESPLVIGVLGRNPYGSQLTEAVRGRTTPDGRRFEVLEVRSSRDLARCHMLFVTSSAEERHLGWLEQIDGLPVLLVGETLDFVESARGAMALILEDAKIRIYLDRYAAERAGLTLRAQLLRLCKPVESPARR